jgi:hypothetical protein
MTESTADLLGMVDEFVKAHPENTLTKRLVLRLAAALQSTEADYERFQRSTAKELADRDAFLIELQKTIQQK